jgi:phenylpyruvate tautomerase
MPLCVFYTNVPSSKVPEDFEVQLSQALADTLSKPIERITVNVLPDQRMVRAGSSEPTCWMNLWSIGVFNAENNPVFASKLYPLINEKLGISNDRIVLLFHDIKPDQVAKPL